MRVTCWSQVEDVSGWEICRDEACEREELHAPHEPPSGRRRRKEKAPLMRDVLSDFVLDQIRRHEFRTYSHIYEGVLYTYGSVCPRRIYRVLVKLKAEGKLRLIDYPEQRLRAYVLPASPLLRDVDGIYEQVLEVSRWSA